MLICEHQDKLIDLVKCIFSEHTNQEKCLYKAKVIEQLLGKNDFLSWNNEKFTLYIDEVLACLFSQEAFNVQSRYTLSLIELVYGLEEDGALENIQYFADKTIEDIKKKFQLKSQEDREREIALNSKIKRDSFEYTKILDYQHFELNNNFAFEFAKRRYSKLYIVEYKYYKRIANNYFKYIGPLLTDRYLNESQDNKQKNEISSYTEILFELLETIQGNKSFFNVIDRLYRIASVQADDEGKQEDESSDLIINNPNSMINHSGTIKKIIYNFRLPRLIESLKWEANVRINFSLPEDQILSYIKHLKSTLGSQTIHIEDGKFLVDKSLGINDTDILKNFHKNIRKNIDIRETVADILFTYDCLKLNLSKTTIADKLNEYYYKTHNKHIKSINDMVSAYTKIAIALIENEEYTVLIDGRIKLGSD